MEVSAFDHGETVDIIVSGEAYEVQLTGNRAASVRWLLEEAMDIDPLDSAEPLVITEPALKASIAQLVAEQLIAV